MNYPPQRNTTSLSRPWTLRQPYVYRYLERQYVHEFFETGALRLSSFKKFAKHEDEARLDTQEGKGLVAHQHKIGKGQSITGYLVYGEDSYVLCGAMRHGVDIMAAFPGANSGFRINDTVRFADCIAHHIPGFKGGSEGPCIYLPKRIVHRNLGPVDETLLHDDNAPGQFSIEKMQNFLSELDSGDQCFLKHRGFGWQCEYRFLWQATQETNDHIFVSAPEAREFCTRLEELEVENMAD